MTIKTLMLAGHVYNDGIYCPNNDRGDLLHIFSNPTTNITVQRIIPFNNPSAIQEYGFVNIPPKTVGNDTITKDWVLLTKLKLSDLQGVQFNGNYSKLSRCNVVIYDPVGDQYLYTNRMDNDLFYKIES